MLRLAVSLLLVVPGLLTVATSCGNDDSDGAGSTTPAVSGSPRNNGAPAGGSPITGQVQLSGKLSGTFTWNKDLALICSPVRVEITMSDGNDTYISITAQKASPTTGVKGETVLGSGKLSGTLRGAEASFETKAHPASPLGASGTISFNGLKVTNAAGDSVTLDGKLTLDCR